MNPLNGRNWKVELARMLQGSKSDFKFNQKGVRNRLMMDIEEGQMAQAERRVREHARGSYFRRHKWATMAVIVILVVGGSGVGLAQNNLSQPGDALYALDQFQEQALLKLPLPETQKAKIRADIVDERNRELDFVVGAAAAPELQDQALDDSMSSLDRAVEAARTSRQEYADQGKDDRAEKMAEVLHRLEALADQQEKRVQALREAQVDEAGKKRYEDRITEIRKFRMRARVEGDGGGEIQPGQVEGDGGGEIQPGQVEGAGWNQRDKTN